MSVGSAGTDERIKAVGRVADHLLDHRPGHVLRVAVDGVTASGKTTFADELAAALKARGRDAVRLSMDGFHHPREHRYRQGRDSPDGYYRDAYDHERFADAVLDPLGPGGTGQYVVAILDLSTDEAVAAELVSAPDDAVLVVDGTFLQSAALAGRWDEVIFLDADLAAAQQRGVARDSEAFGGVDAAARAFETRYHAACRLYLDEVDPTAYASVLVDNTDVHRPVVRRIGGTDDVAAALFAYGTLQQTDVQLLTFGRELAGRPDSVPGYRKDWVTITDPEVVAASGSDRHPIVRPSADPTDSVAGTVLTVTTRELAAADTYEVGEYRRVRVTLASGSAAWIYLAAP